MPTLFRFLYLLALIAGVIYGTMWSLTVFVEPRPRDITVRIPSERINKPEPTAGQTDPATPPEGGTAQGTTAP